MFIFLLVSLSNKAEPSCTNAWLKHIDYSESYHALHHKLKKTGIRLSAWSRGLFSKAKIQHHAALLVILHLDMAQESRTLSPTEADLCARLKRRVIGLVVPGKSNARALQTLKRVMPTPSSSTAGLMPGVGKIISIGSSTIMDGSPTMHTEKPSFIATFPRS